MNATQIILIVFIVLLIIIYPILISLRNKKENQKIQEQTNSLKRGDKIITTSGVYGTIVDLHLDDNKKIVTIETGTGKNKGYVSIDAYSIYTIIKDEESTSEKATVSQVAENKEVSQDDAVEMPNNVEESATSSSQSEKVDSNVKNSKKGKKKD